LKQLIDNDISVPTGWDDGLEEFSDLVECHEETAAVPPGDDDSDDDREISDGEENGGGNNDEDDPHDKDNRNDDDVSDNGMLEGERTPLHQFKASRH
jgi:hypothetical protein